MKPIQGYWESFRLLPREVAAEARRLRALDADFANWADGCGVILHQPEVQIQVRLLADALVQRSFVTSHAAVYAKLRALDHIANQAMWLVVHMSYAKRLYLDGRELQPGDFKRDPQGHTGGSLNMVPAYAALLAINNLTQQHRDWIMGQGHCVAAIDAVQLLTQTALPDRQLKYPLTDEGLSRFAADFYNYRINPDGTPISTLGSHVNVHTAGARMEGGYLGFAGLQYVHQPLAGERLVAFLSDGAFEEQRGSDWAARWWRPHDTGLTSPIMIANGRRIDQRTTVAQQGGSAWFVKHLQHQGFAPFVIDGRDPAAFVTAIFFMEQQLEAAGKASSRGDNKYPVALPYCIAETEKGYGFPGAGSNDAHGLPIAKNPRMSEEARNLFNQGAAALLQPEVTRKTAGQQLRQPDSRSRNTSPQLQCPEPLWSTSAESPMAAIDRYFVQIIASNPGLRVRVGNPDEMRSNRLNQTLNLLKHRVTDPEPGIAEALDGSVITALNEEAVVCACLANDRGLNLVVSYEAFATKMFGALRQSIIFSRHQKAAGKPATWLGVPVISTSHLWENGKNEQSHQDPGLAESMLGEMSDMARVMFPADSNSAMTSLQECYTNRGVIFNLVIPKSDMPAALSKAQAQQLTRDGAIRLCGDSESKLQLVACGAFQLHQALLASARLSERGEAHALVYMIEPGRFRAPRDAWEAEIQVEDTTFASIFGRQEAFRVFLLHARPEAVLGQAKRLDQGPRLTRALGYINQGGTLDAAGLLFANRCTWAHALEALALLANRAPSDWLSLAEIAAIQGVGDPYCIVPHPYDGLDVS